MMPISICELFVLWTDRAGVEGIIVCTYDGIPLKSTMAKEATMQYTSASPSSFFPGLACNRAEKSGHFLGPTASTHSRTACARIACHAGLVTQLALKSRATVRSIDPEVRVL